MDRGYLDFLRLHRLHAAGAFFVTQLKTNTCYYVVAPRAVAAGKRENALPGSLHQVLQAILIAALEKTPLPELFAKLDTTNEASDTASNWKSMSSEQAAVPSAAVLELRYRRMLVLALVAKQKAYGPLELTVIYAEERGTPKGRERIRWKLLTELPVRSVEEAIEKLSWYALRWKIEVFHKLLKSGCKVEASRLRTAPRLVNLVATCCIVAWRIFWRHDAQPQPARYRPDDSADPARTSAPRSTRPGSKTTVEPCSLSHYISKIARLGGYLARARDPDPGNIVMWRGLARLTDIALGFSLRDENVGN